MSENTKAQVPLILTLGVNGVKVVIRILVSLVYDGIHECLFVHIWVGNEILL